MDFEKEYGIKLKCNYFNMIPIEMGIAFGTTDSIIIMQVLYWMKKFQNSPDHNKDGRTWVYNTYDDWIKLNFPYLSRNTVIRAFDRLEKQGVILSANYNKMKFDKTKWYSVDVEKLNEVLQGVQIEQCVYPKWVDEIPIMGTADTQNGQTNTITYTPYNSSNNNNIGIQGRVPEKPKHNAGDIPFDFMVVERQFRKACKELEAENVDDVLYVVKKFYQCWFRNFGWSGEPPRRLSQREVEQCVRSMWEYEDDSGCIEYIELWEYDEMIERYFDIDFPDCDYSLTHFLSGKIRQYRLYETAL